MLGFDPSLRTEPTVSVSKEQRQLRNRFMVASDVIGFTFTLALAFFVRFETFALPPDQATTFFRFLPFAVGLKIAILFFAGLYRRLWRHAGVVELERIGLAASLSGVVVIVAGVWLLPALGYLESRVPISVAALDAIATLVVVVAPRFMIRILASRPGGRADVPARRAIIAGAGSAGEMIARELRTATELGLVPVAFVDDDVAKHGLELRGLPVAGSADRLVDFRERYLADELIIAIPSASGAAIRRLTQLAAAAGLTTRTIPGMYEILSGKVSVNSLRPVQIEDLLRREPVRLDLDRLSALVEDRTVLVTGAGGSIGSEIARQVATLGPGRLVVLGHGENSIFNVTQELTERFPGVEIIPVVADVRDRGRIDRVFRTLQPGLVLHAAAHKHVPMMEINVVEAITNNIGGSKNIAEASAEFGVSRLVMISTDKAVRPTNVMGATKRVAEQVVQSLAQQANKNFISVRFGNVLGSRGSVVPIFLRQIEAGGPITITHPEMRRFFMTIPESVQLVLQAASIGTGGEVFVLDMGESVKIVDLATDLIRLSGLEVGRDIELHFTGVRPGEKLYEELFFGAEHAEPTDHAKVLRAKHEDLPLGLSAVVDELLARAWAGRPDYELLEYLRRLVPDYHPENSVHNISARSERPDARIPIPPSSRRP